MLKAGPASSTAMRCHVRPAREGARQLRRRHRPFALIEQLDVAAERDGGRCTYSARSAPATRLNSGLPKPTEKRSTLKPRRRATQKWPNSCTVTSRPTATTNQADVPQQIHARAPFTDALLVHAEDPLTCAHPAFRVGGQHLVQAASHAPRAPLHYGFNDRRNAGKVQSARPGTPAPRPRWPRSAAPAAAPPARAAACASARQRKRSRIGRPEIQRARP